MKHTDSSTSFSPLPHHISFLKFLKERLAWRSGHNYDTHQFPRKAGKSSALRKGLCVFYFFSGGRGRVCANQHLPGSRISHGDRCFTKHNILPYLGTVSLCFILYHHLGDMQHLQKKMRIPGNLCSMCSRGLSLLWPGFPGVELHMCSGVHDSLPILKPWSTF